MKMVKKDPNDWNISGGQPEIDNISVKVMAPQFCNEACSEKKNPITE